MKAGGIQPQSFSDKVLPWNVLQTDRPDLRDAGTPVLDQNRELTLAMCNSAPAIPKLIFKIEWPQLIELMGLIERKPGIEAAIGDLYAAAEALVVDRTACL